MRRIRLTLLRIRRSLRSYRVLFGAVATALAAVLGTGYDDLPESLRTTTLIALGVMTGLTALLIGGAGDPPRPLEDQASTFFPTGSAAATDLQTGHGRAVRGVGRPRVRWRRWLGRIGRWPSLRWRRSAIPVLPAGDGSFAGRGREIKDLLDRHAAARGKRDAAPSGRRVRAGGPVLVLIHGRAGVGKTVLAAELARELRDEYRDGQVFANLGTGGAARRPADVLQDILALLGWQDDEMPAELDKRAKLFRALTAGRRMLIVLDAARDGNQLHHLLPRDPGCAVIVTSRRDLSGNIDSECEPYRLDPPDLADCLEILHTVSGVPHGSRQPYVVRIAQMCGALPLALRSAGERVALDGTDICHVASLLEPAETRLSWLDRPGRAVTEGIHTQYDRALRAEQQALQLLALVPSATFFPWVLRPLLDVPFAEAEALVTRLTGAQLLAESPARSRLHELPRYRFHPLDRLFVEQRLAELTVAARDAAQQRLDDAYYEFVVKVLRPDQETGTTHWVPAGSNLPERIAERPDQWVRAEYASLLRVIITAAARGDDYVCWRVGVWLGGCVPEYPDTALIGDAFQIALHAANRFQDSEPIGAIDVLLAHGAFLAAVEHYGPAETAFQEAIAKARALREDSAVQPDLRHRAALREARAHRKRGEAFLQAASYRLACTAFDEAMRISVRIGDPTERRLARLLIAEARQADLVDSDYDELLDSPEQPDSVHFRVLLSLAEVERRRGDWRNAEDNLARAGQLATDDERGLATLYYRLGRLYLHQHRLSSQQPVPDDAQAGLANQAVRHATEALLVFERMHNRAGLVRARCLLARALLHTRRLVEAEQVISLAASGLDELAASGLDTSTDSGPDESAGAPSYAVEPLRARVLRARAELAVVNRDADARTMLTQAAQMFGNQDDWAAQSEILRMIEKLDTPV
ncbi:NB-ARC domain-containing protein [Solwaraspora sp. WMMB335]|uniref:NB-ARC domain-containing protein n=1 Tax=Solwaraspora sp. WMMB335 TaxID=3404118 RepID=UPI003B94CE2D